MRAKKKFWWDQLCKVKEISDRSFPSGYRGCSCDRSLARPPGGARSRTWFFGVDPLRHLWTRTLVFNFISSLFNCLLPRRMVIIDFFVATSKCIAALLINSHFDILFSFWAGVFWLPGQLESDFQWTFHGQSSTCPPQKNIDVVFVNCNKIFVFSGVIRPMRAEKGKTQGKHEGRKIKNYFSDVSFSVCLRRWDSHL